MCRRMAGEERLVVGAAVRDHVLRYKIHETTEVTEIIRHKIDMTR